MELTVYIPVEGSLVQIDRGSGIVGEPIPVFADEPETALRILVDYEGNRYGAVNIKTYADRVNHAADRHVTDYPTVARSALKVDDLLQVGFFDTETKQIRLANDEADEIIYPLCAWIGIDLDDLEAELQVTSGRDRGR